MSNIKSHAIKGICTALEVANKVIPIKSIESVNCFSAWLDSHYKLETDPISFVEADYYNGSENDYINIFNELLNLAKHEHCYNGNYVLKRIEFLANEGLFLSTVDNKKSKTFKVPSKDVNKLISELSKKSSKKTKKKSKKKLRRDKNGRFTRNK